MSKEKKWGDVMALITEEDIRKRVHEGAFEKVKELMIDASTIVTPSARGYLTQLGITIKKEGPRIDQTRQKEGIKMSQKEENQLGEATDTVYETLFGGRLYEKPEHMTHLRGNVLVFKDHPIIALRGAIDSLESEIILAQIVSNRLGKKKLTEDLEEIIGFIRKLLRCEITGESVEGFSLQGLNEASLREQSYHPSTYFGVKHFLPTYKKGEMVAYLNRLRTMTRHTELIAYQAFKNEYGQVTRNDMIQAWNRLSSLFWIMMFKEITGKYDQ